jgi:hypothetical protein
VGSREAAVFRLFNTLALPDWTWPGVWLVMQFGVIGAVPLVAVVAVATRHLRLALDAVLAAGSIYLIAKVIKDFVQRGRPDTLLNDVHILGEPAGGLDTSPGTPQSRSRWPPGEPVPGPAVPAPGKPHTVGLAGPKMPTDSRMALGETAPARQRDDCGRRARLPGLACVRIARTAPRRARSPRRAAPHRPRAVAPGLPPSGRSDLAGAAEAVHTARRAAARLPRVVGLDACCRPPGLAGSHRMTVPSPDQVARAAEHYVVAEIHRRGGWAA